MYLTSSTNNFPILTYGQSEPMAACNDLLPLLLPPPPPPTSPSPLLLFHSVFSFANQMWLVACELHDWQKLCHHKPGDWPLFTLFLKRVMKPSLQASRTSATPSLQVSLRFLLCPKRELTKASLQAFHQSCNLQTASHAWMADEGGRGSSSSRSLQAAIGSHGHG